MRWSKLFIPTLRESPAGDESDAFKLLVRAGYTRAASTGVYGWLPLGQRALSRIRRIAREEIEGIGGQQVHLTAAAASAIGLGELRSPKQLPQVWFRLDAAPLRARQFLGMEVFYFGMEPAAVHAAAGRILERSGLSYRDAGDGFCVLHQSGEESVVVCAKCGYTASPRAAVSQPTPPPPDPEGDLAPEPFHTPGQKTIADIARFTGLPESAQMKSLVLVANQAAVLVMLRGDHQLNEAKFALVSGDAHFRQALPGEIEQWFGAQAGSLGPVGVRNLRILGDTALAGRRNMICGANRDDYHLRHVTPEEDFALEWHDLRGAAAGEFCSQCGGVLAIAPAIEVVRGGAGVCRISLERILTGAIELGHDQDGMVLPRAIAPFDVVVTAATVSEGAEQVYREIAAAFDALYDDRDERAGVKFKDADLIGVPLRVNVGRKLAEGVVELVDRKTRQAVDVAAGEIVGAILRLQGGYGAKR
jgi:prolyl-tRNA synthetase